MYYIVLRVRGYDSVLRYVGSTAPVVVFLLLYLSRQVAILCNTPPSSMATARNRSGVALFDLLIHRDCDNHDSKHISVPYWDQSIKKGDWLSTRNYRKWYLWYTNTYVRSLSTDILCTELYFKFVGTFRYCDMLVLQHQL